MTDEQKILMQLIGYDDDMNLMNCIWEMDLKMEELRRGYYQKYFRKDLKRAWGFNCYHCGERVQSDKDESYYIVTITWKDPNKQGKRFCSKECAGVFYNESMEWLLKKQQEYEIERTQLQKND
ncbi:hypothetical protein P4604_08530 [Lysinibacillus capsici]|uniref:hypothetical protein n=1 Tax=Lysinibacillus capsici TaxID=2115968 RepID=UPI002E24407B|nr:hypothetical protein [Lysinibacillus capsici]